MTRSNIVTMKPLTDRERVIKDNADVNPNQKPVLFFQEYLQSLPAVGFVVDLFSGTGTASAAALGYHKDFVAVEKDDTQAELIVERLKRFDCHVPLKNTIPRDLPEVPRTHKPLGLKEVVTQVEQAGQGTVAEHEGGGDCEGENRASAASSTSSQGTSSQHSDISHLAKKYRIKKLPTGTSKKK